MELDAEGLQDRGIEPTLRTSPNLYSPTASQVMRIMRMSTYTSYYKTYVELT